MIATPQPCLLADFILNNKLVLFLSVALFAFVISTISLASSNSSKKTAIEQCEASIWEATEVRS